MTECPIHPNAIRCYHYGDIFNRQTLVEFGPGSFRSIDLPLLYWENGVEFGTISLAVSPMTEEAWNNWIDMYKSGMLIGWAP